jgi:xanthosine utilization system XapX-like protein
MNMQTLFQTGLLLQITPGRLSAILAGLVGLASIVIGVLVLTRRIRSGRPWAIVTLVVALTGIVLGVLHLARTTGGFGTGKGRAGAIVAIIIGLVGMVLGRTALIRSRRTAADDPK